MKRLLAPGIAALLRWRGCNHWTQRDTENVVGMVSHDSHLPSNTNRGQQTLDCRHRRLRRPCAQATRASPLRFAIGPPRFASALARVDPSFGRGDAVQRCQGPQAEKFGKSAGHRHDLERAKRQAGTGIACRTCDRKFFALEIFYVSVQCFFGPRHF